MNQLLLQIDVNRDEDGTRAENVRTSQRDFVLPRGGSDINGNIFKYTNLPTPTNRLTMAQVTAKGVSI